MFFKLILTLLALFGLYVWLGGFWRRRFAFEPGYGAVHFVSTRDACRIALYRYRAASQRYATPVLLCHGLAANRFNFDLGPEVSLARFLQKAGFEVWSIDLRGRGIPRRDAGGGACAGRPPVFDDYVREDARAAIRYVLGETGASRVHWVGHSMGGLVLYAVLQGEEAESVASGVAIGSPGSFAGMGRGSLAYVLFRLLGSLPRVPLALLAAGVAPLIARIRFPWEALFVNRRNVEVRSLERALCFLVADMWRGELSQFLDWMKRGEIPAHDGRGSLDQNWGAVRQPVFFIAGAGDLLVPPPTVAAAHDRIASQRKAFLILGREHGQEEDYGHGDLLIGKNVRREVFPRILEWLESFESP